MGGQFAQGAGEGARRDLVPVHDVRASAGRLEAGVRVLWRGLLVGDGVGPHVRTQRLDLQGERGRERGRQRSPAQTTALRVTLQGHLLFSVGRDGYESGLGCRPVCFSRQ